MFLEIWGGTLILALILAALIWPLTFIHLLLFGFFGLCLNIISNLGTIDSFIATHLFGCLTVFLLTLEIFGIRQSCNPIRHPAIASKRLRKISIVSAVCASLALIVYHYSVIGIPLLSDNISVARFQVAASGLFGIPSRFATYAPSLIFFFVLSMLVGRVIGGPGAFILIIVSGALLALQGHKSSLLQLPLLALIAYQILDRRTLKYLMLWSALIAPIGAYFVYEVFMRIGGFGDLAFFDYLLERFTGIAMAPVYSMYSNSFEPIALGNSYMLNDIAYPFMKVIGGNFETVNLQLSRFIYGVESGEFSVPVTPGIFPYFYSDLGLSGSLIATAILSWLSIRIIRKSCSAKTISKTVFYLWLQYTMYVGVSSGNIFYLLPNTLLVFVIFWVFERSFDALCKSYAIKWNNYNSEKRAAA